MQDFYVKVGDSVTFAKTVGETDIYLFAGITGDFSVNHVNEQYMAQSKYGRRIAHGALMVGYMSTCSTKMIEQCGGTDGDETPPALAHRRSSGTLSYCSRSHVVGTRPHRVHRYFSRRSHGSCVASAWWVRARA